jgi:hypothetical protein
MPEQCYDVPVGLRTGFNFGPGTVHRSYGPPDRDRDRTGGPAEEASKLQAPF